MQCPRCTQVLEAGLARDSDVLPPRCPQCRGFWFERRQIERILPAAARDLRVPGHAKRGIRRCPVCHQRMHAFFYPGTLVEVDMCSPCRGLWIDAGELREIRVLREAAMSSSGSQDNSHDLAGVTGLVIDVVDLALHCVQGW